MKEYEVNAEFTTGDDPLVYFTDATDEEHAIYQITLELVLEGFNTEDIYLITAKEV